MAPLIVVKIGTSTLMQAESQRINLPNLGALVDTITCLHEQGYSVIIVTSAAVGFGCLKLKLKERPKKLALKQAVAAAGQSSLIRMYEELFGMYDVPVAQVLLTRYDFCAKDRYANVRNALSELLELGVIPIINENDTVSTEELRFGDNDTLSALVAVAMAADKLFLLTDVDSLYTSNPRTNPDARPIAEMSAAELAQFSTGGETASSGGQWGTGGMATKIIAARTAVCAGIETILCHGAFPARIKQFVASKTAPSVGTIFRAEKISGMTDLRRWLLALPVRGTIMLDAGACKSVLAKSSLFAAGIVAVQGNFLRDESVSLVDGEMKEIARALVNLDSREMDKVKGLKSSEHAAALGFFSASEVAYRSNIVLV